MPVLAQLVDDVVVNKIELSPGTLTVGRHPDCDIQIDDATVSSRHAILRIAPSEYLDNLLEVTVEDQGSTNGTFVNEQQIDEPRLLTSNDVVRMGFNKFKFVDETQDELEGTAHLLQT